MGKRQQQEISYAKIDSLPYTWLFTLLLFLADMEKVPATVHLPTSLAEAKNI